MSEPRATSGAATRPIRVCSSRRPSRSSAGRPSPRSGSSSGLRTVPGLEVDFLPHDPRTNALLRQLQRVKYVRTVATSVAYVESLLRRLPQYDVVHVFSASYWSFLLAPTPAILIGKWLGKRVVVNYRSGEAEDHLTRWPRTSVPTLQRADAVATPSELSRRRVRTLRRSSRVDRELRGSRRSALSPTRPAAARVPVEPELPVRCTTCRACCARSR